MYIVDTHTYRRIKVSGGTGKRLTLLWMIKNIHEKGLNLAMP